MELCGKVALSPTEQAILAAAQLLLNGENCGSISLTSSEQALTVESNFLDQVYGLALPTLAENLEHSIFAPDSGSSFALDQQTYDEILSLLSGEMLAEAAAVSAEMTAETDELTAALEPLVNLFAGMTQEASQYLIYQTRKTNVTIHGVSIPVTQTSVIGDAQTLSFVCNSLMDSFESDVQVQSAVATLIELFAEMEEGASGQDYVNIILESMPELREEVAEMLEQSDFQLAVTACVMDDEASTPVKFALDITMDDEDVSLALLMSPEMDYFRLEAAGYITYALELTIQYEDGILFQLDSLEDEELQSRYQLCIGDFAYELVMTDIYTFYNVESESWYQEEYTTSFAGTYAISDNLFTLTLNEVNGEDIGANITLNLRNNDSFTVPAFTELTGLSEEAFTQVVQDLMAGVETLDAFNYG